MTTLRDKVVLLAKNQIPDLALCLEPSRIPPQFDSVLKENIRAAEDQDSSDLVTDAGSL